MPLQKVQQQTTSREFVWWCDHLQELKTRREPVHWYLAQVAMEVAKLRRPKQKLKLEQFLLTFTTTGSKGTPKTAEQIQEHKQRSKAFWFGSIMGTKT